MCLRGSLEKALVPLALSVKGGGGGGEGGRDVGRRCVCVEKMRVKRRDVS